MLSAFFLLAIGFLFGVWWFSVTILTLFYGLPKATYWCARGLFSWKLLLPYVVSPVLWNIAFLLVGWGLFAWAPSFTRHLLDSRAFFWGQWLGIGISLVKSLTTRDPREDFVSVARSYAHPGNPDLLLEFTTRNPTKAAQLEG